MPPRQTNPFTTIRTEGGLLPANFLQRVTEGDRDLEGIQGADYHLLPEERFNEVITRSWTRLLAAWETFSKAMGNLPESDLGTTLTRERWLLPLFQELGYGRLQTSKAFDIEGRSYPISHMWKNCPIHIVSFRLDLDKRTAGTAGAARTSPHGLLQEFLNRSDDHLWGFLSNGLTLRILRDNVSFTRQSYVEFDLEAMMDGEVYADFVLLWLLCHESRVEAERPEECWLERWCKEAQEHGTRALDTLRIGVEKAIASLGSGFLSANRGLRGKLFSGKLDKYDYYRQLLRLVYRLLFLFVAEDRDLLLAPDADPKSKERYLKYYSLSRIRTLALKQRGGKHGDLWNMLSLVFSALGSEHNSPAFGLSPLGSFLWSPDAIPDLNGCNLSNRDLLEAVRHLAFTVEGRIQRPVDYKNLGSEELGSIYESLLELHPDLNTDAQTFELKTAAGNERKTTGSYYTPTSLITCLLESALTPILEEAAKKSNPEQEILGLKICDPACGSGHFLVAASHRVAKQLASIRTGDAEPSPDAHRDALRDVIARCIYGVDLNPMSVELCKVSLWMESMEPGKPLAFLDHHIQCGNSLLGTNPDLLSEGIPDEAFKPIEGDDPAYCRRYKAINKQERKTKQMTLFSHDYKAWEHLSDLATSLGELDNIKDDSIEGVNEKQRRYKEIVESTGYEHNRFISDAWCAAFVWKKEKSQDVPYPITENVLRTVESNPLSTPTWLKQEVLRLANQYRFFHWHLAFPDVFKVSPEGEKADSETGLSGGFDVVLGNPPWEKLQTEELQFFASRNPGIASLAGAKRKIAIEELRTTDPRMAEEWEDQKRADAGVISFIRNSGIFKLTGVGKFNTFALFAELSYRLISEYGRVGCIVPSGIATDDTTKLFIREIIDKHSLISLYDFENRDAIFQGVHRSYKFCLLTLGGTKQSQDGNVDCIFFATNISDLKNVEKKFTLCAKDVSLLNPNTKTCPIFRSRKDAEITKYIYQQVPVFLDESKQEGSDYSPRIWRLLNTTDDSSEFITPEDKEELILIPVVEAKTIHQFDHRYATFHKKNGVLETREFDPSEKVDPFAKVNARYYISDSYFIQRLPDHLKDREWFLTARNITNATNERTVISSIFPRGASCEVTPYIETSKGATGAAFLLSIMNSYVFDYVTRQKIGGTHLSYFIIHQLPVLSWSHYSKPCQWLNNNLTLGDWLLPRVLELTYTTWDLASFSQETGWSGPPFRWDEERRFMIRCELDAAFFHLYLPTDTEGNWSRNVNEIKEDFTRLTSIFPTPRDAVTYIMDTFPIVRRKDEAKYDGGYRTKRFILEIYDALAKAIRTGQSYQSILDPLPGPPMDADSNYIPITKWAVANWPSHVHLPQEVPIPRGEEITLEEFVSLAYPASNVDRAICAAAITIVEQSHGISSADHLDALLLATHPEWCRAFLDQHDRSNFDAIRSSVQQDLFVNEARSIEWRECRDYLEQQKAISVNHWDKGQAISIGADLAAIKTVLPGGVDKIIHYVIIALHRVHDLRNNTSLATPDQMRIIQDFEKQHKDHKLAA